MHSERSEEPHEQFHDSAVRVHRATCEILRFAQDDKQDVALIQKANRKGIAIELSFARFQRRNNDEHGVRQPEQNQNRDSTEDDAKNPGNYVVDQHRELEIQRLLAVRIDFRRFAPFHQPNN